MVPLVLRFQSPNAHGNCSLPHYPAGPNPGASQMQLLPASRSHTCPSQALLRSPQCPSCVCTTDTSAPAPPLVPTLFQECTSNGPCLLHQIHIPMSSIVTKLAHTSPTRTPIHTSPCPWPSPEDMAGCLHPGQLVQAGDTWLTEVKVQPSARPTRPNLAPCPPHRHPS